MKALKRNMFFIFVTVLAVFTSLTLLQIYYNAYIHLLIFGCCLIFANKRYKFAVPLAVGGLVCFLFIFLSINKYAVTPMEQLGFYLHYITWPVLLIAAVNSLTLNQKLIIMRLMLIVGIVSSLLSLRVLFVDSSISRLLAGAATEAEMYEYYGKGVGGYGTVYATVFLCFGAIYWFAHTKSKADKALIIIYLITAYIFILYASYTTAILITVVISMLALTSKVKPMIKSLLIIALVAVLFLVCWDLIMEVALKVLNELKLYRVIERLTQLTEASESHSLSSLTRSQLYLMSWESFLEHPLVGSDVAGAHSQILDNLAYFGIVGIFMPVLFGYYSIKCIKLSSWRLALFYIMFFALIFVNTCSAMQIPVSVFFLCPLIVNTVKEQQAKAKVKNENTTVSETGALK